MLFGHAYAASTTAKYTQHEFYWARFLVYLRLGHRLLDADESVFLLYATWLSRSCSYPTIRNYLCGVRALYLRHGRPDPLTAFHRLPLLLKGIRRVTGRPVQRARPVTPALLLRWRAQLDIPRSPADTACFAAMLFAFFGFFRKATVCAGDGAADANLHLQRRDVTFDAQRGGLWVRVRQSKTNPNRERVDTVFIAANPAFLALDPVIHYIALLQQNPAPPGAAAFGYNVNGVYRPLTQRELVRRAQQLTASAGLDTTSISGHSVRRGAATFAFSVGVSSLDIKHQGIWASDVYHQYVDVSLEQRAACTARMNAAIAAGFLGDNLGHPPHV